MQLLIKLKYILARLGYFSKPDFMIIGAQKAGTTSLTSVLRQHSRISGSTRKEVHYFDDDTWYSKKDLNEYHSYFPLPTKVPKGNLVFEATPNYLFHNAAAQRIFDYNPDLKLIVILRNPSTRALSAWTMFHVEYRNPSFSGSLIDRIQAEIHEIKDSIDSNEFNIVQNGLYYQQIQNYLKYFDKNQLFILSLEELIADFDGQIRTLLSFLDIPYQKLVLPHMNKKVEENDSRYKEELRILDEFYHHSNQKLFEFLGKDLGW